VSGVEVRSNVTNGERSSFLYSRRISLLLNAHDSRIIKLKRKLRVVSPTSATWNTNSAGLDSHLEEYEPKEKLNRVFCYI
jgi:hypothetical protein